MPRKSKLADVETKPALAPPSTTAKAGKKSAAPRKAKGDKEPGSWVTCEGTKVTLAGKDCGLSKKYAADRARQDKDGVKRLDVGPYQTVIEFVDAKAAFKFYKANGNSIHDAIEDGDDTGWWDPSMDKAAKALADADEE